MLKDSMQTLSTPTVQRYVTEGKHGEFTDVVSLVEDDDGVFRHVLGYLLGHFRIEKIMERVNDNIHERQLEMRSVTRKRA